MKLISTWSHTIIFLRKRVTKYDNMKLTVPYYSQYVDIQDPFWMIRACGAMCLKMVAEFHTKDIGDAIIFCNSAKESGGYDMSNGWVHDYLIEEAKKIGLQAERKEGLQTLNEIIASLDVGNPVIVSVEKRVLEQKRFHMIVVVGYEDDRVWYHESESTDKEKGKFRMCTTLQFLEFWRGKAIFITQ